MARLTIWTGQGAALNLDNPKNELEAKQQLMEKYKLAINKLAEYEDADERLFSMLKAKLQSGASDISTIISTTASDKLFNNMLWRRYGNNYNLIAVYKNPKDYPKQYVGRLFLINAGNGTTKSTDVVIAKNILNELRRLIPYAYTRLNRDIEDDPVIYETWIW